MARRIDWQLSNFGAGLHTRPYQVESGDVYASDMSNLRVNGDGQLEIRYPIRWTGKSLGDTIQGFSVSKDAEKLVIPYLLANGVLKLLIIGGTDVSVVTDTKISGKIQSLFLIKDVALVISEGTDQGYWLNLESFDPPNTPTVTRHHFGIDKPVVSSATAISSDGAGALGGNTYYYVLTRIRRDSPFQLMESVASNYIFVDMGVGHDTVALDALPTSTEANSGANEQRIWRTESTAAGLGIFSTATGGNATSVIDSAITYGQFTDVQAGWIVINQTDKSQGVVTDVFPDQDTVVCAAGFAGGTDNTFASGDVYRIIAEPTFYLLDTIDITDSDYTDLIADASMNTNTQLAAAQVVRNTRIPTTTKTIAKYNDRLWAATGGELRYSDIRGADSYWWAFPEVNALWYNSEIHTVVVYREMLLFGGPTGLWRLIGTDETNFDIRQISGLGPAFPHSWCMMEGQTSGQNLFTFVGLAGLYISNGVDVIRINEPLSGFSQPFAAQIKDASCIHMPSDETLYSLSLARSDGDKVFNFLRRPDGTWQKWEGVDINQAHTVEQTSLVTLQKSFDVYIAEEGEDEIREILWDNPSFTQDLTEDDGTKNISWFWESNLIDWRAQGLADTLKTFRKVEVTVDSDTVISISVEIDGSFAAGFTKTVSPPTAQRPTPFPVNRRGENIKLKLSGTSAPSAIKAVRIIATVPR